MWAVGSPAQGAVLRAVLGGGKVTVAVLNPERLLLGKSPSACCRKWGCSSRGQGQGGIPMRGPCSRPLGSTGFLVRITGVG